MPATIQIGIDEAGYGPILGPLILGGTAFVGCPGQPQEFLSDIVSPVPSPQHLMVNDSKEVLKRTKGMARLRESVETFFQAYHRCFNPDALVPDLQTICLPFKPPWYADSLPLLTKQQPKLELLEDVFQKIPMPPPVLRAVVIPAVDFNHAIRSGMNKSDLLGEQACRLLSNLLDCVKGSRLPVEVTCDRQGGRRYYADMLALLLPVSKITILTEEPKCSEYRIDDPDFPEGLTFRFMVKADSSSLPVALASMIAKYTREYYMERFNVWWSQYAPDLQPTKGYVVDGRRFLSDISGARIVRSIDYDLMVRCR